MQRGGLVSGDGNGEESRLIWGLISWQTIQDLVTGQTREEEGGGKT